MGSKIVQILKVIGWIILTVAVVVAINAIALVLGCPKWLLVLLDAFIIFWGSPQLVVMFRSNDEKRPLPRKEKGYWATKVQPGHGKLSMKAGVPNRLIPGPGYKFSGDNLEDRASWIASERAVDETTGGGRLSHAMKLFDAWLHVVTGYRFIGRTVLDTISPTTELYLREITREATEFTPSDVRPKDITDHFVLAQQQRPFRFSEAETSRAGTIKVAGQEISADEGVPLEGTGTYLLRLVDMWKVLFEIGGDELSISKQKAEEGAREMIQGGIAEQFLGASGKSILAEGLASIDENKDSDGTVNEAGVHKGTRDLFGFEYTKFIITDLDLGGKFKDLFRKKAEERVIGLAAKEAAERERDVAIVKLETAKLNAKGTVAIEQEELAVLQASALGLRNNGAAGGLGSTDATAILTAREKRKGVEGFKGGTLVLSDGGQPTPVLVSGDKPSQPTHVPVSGKSK